MEIKDIIVKDFSQTTKDYIKSFRSSIENFKCDSNGSIKTQIRIYIHNINSSLKSNGNNH